MSKAPLILVGGSLVILLAMSASGRGLSSALSERRMTGLRYIDSVIPSAYNDPRFMDIVGPGFIPNDPSLPKGYSACGALPGRVGRIIGYTDAITGYGVSAVRTKAIEKKAWVVSGGNRIPRRLDFLLLEEYEGGPVKHVCVTYSVSRYSDSLYLIVTADSGQGTLDQPAAKFVKRLYEPSTGTIVSFTEKNGTKVWGPKRYLPGWLDIDRLPPPSKKKTLVETIAPNVNRLDLVSFDKEGAT